MKEEWLISETRERIVSHAVKYYRMLTTLSVGLCVAMKIITPIIIVMVGWIGNNKETMRYN